MNNLSSPEIRPHDNFLSPLFHTQLYKKNSIGDSGPLDSQAWLNVPGIIILTIAGSPRRTKSSISDYLSEDIGQFCNRDVWIRNIGDEPFPSTGHTIGESYFQGG
jgi:hypothetical protein